MDARAHSPFGGPLLRCFPQATVPRQQKMPAPVISESQFKRVDQPKRVLLRIEPSDRDHQKITILESMLGPPPLPGPWPEVCGRVDSVSDCRLGFGAIPLAVGPPPLLAHRHGGHPAAESEAMQQPPGEVGLLCGEVVHRVDHRRIPHGQAGGQAVAQHVGMGVDHVRPEFAHDSPQPRDHPDIQARAFTEVPYRNAGGLKFLLESPIGSVVEGNHAGLKPIWIQPASQRHRHPLGAGALQGGQNL